MPLRILNDKMQMVQPKCQRLFWYYLCLHPLE